MILAGSIVPSNQHRIREKGIIVFKFLPFLLVTLTSLNLYSQSFKYVMEPSNINKKVKYLRLESFDQSKSLAATLTLENNQTVSASFHDYDGYIQEGHFDKVTNKNKKIIVLNDEMILATFKTRYKTPSRPGEIQKYTEAICNSDGYINLNINTRDYRLDFYSFISEIEATLGQIYGINGTEAEVISSRFVYYKGVIYDAYDFGNMIWGAVMRWIGFNYTTIQIGSNLNESYGSLKFFRNGYIKKGFKTLIQGDSPGDQKAIKKGYYELFNSLFSNYDTSLSLDENIGEFNYDECSIPLDSQFNSHSVYKVMSNEVEGSNTKDQ